MFSIIQDIASKAEALTPEDYRNIIAATPKGIKLLMLIDTIHEAGNSSSDLLRRSKEIDELWEAYIG